MSGLAARWRQRFLEAFGLVEDMGETVTKLRKDLELVWDRYARAQAACSHADLSMHAHDLANVINSLYAEREAAVTKIDRLRAEVVELEDFQAQTWALGRHLRERLVLEAHSSEYIAAVKDTLKWARELFPEDTDEPIAGRSLPPDVLAALDEVERMAKPVLAPLDEVERMMAQPTPGERVKIGDRVRWSWPSQKEPMEGTVWDVRGGHAYMKVETNHGTQVGAAAPLARIVEIVEPAKGGGT